MHQPQLQPSQRQTEFESLLKQHAAAGVQAAKSGRPEAGEITALLKQVQADRKASEFGAGVEKLKRLAEILTGAAPARSGAPGENAGPTIAKGRVKKQVYLRERWSLVPGEVKLKIAPLLPTIGVEVADALDQFLNDMIQEINENIQDSIDQGASDFSGVISEIRTARKQVQTDELIRHLSSHPSLPGLEVESAFVSALDDLEQQLAS